MRGDRPTDDRILASRMGVAAIDALRVLSVVGD